MEFSCLYNLFYFHDDSTQNKRLVLNNVKVVQTWEALVYHFTCTSSRGPAWFDKENKEAQQRLQVQQEADSYELCRFTITWGAFKHGDLTEDGYEKSKYYNIIANIKNANDLNKLYNFEMFFNEVYLHSSSFIVGNPLFRKKFNSSFLSEEMLTSSE